MFGLVVFIFVVVKVGIIIGFVIVLGEDVFLIDGREIDGDEGGVLFFIGGEFGFFFVFIGIIGIIIGVVCLIGDGVFFFFFRRRIVLIWW